MIKILVQLHRPGRIECLVVDAGAYRWVTIASDVDRPHPDAIAAMARLSLMFGGATLRITAAQPADADANARASNVIPLHR